MNRLIIVILFGSLGLFGCKEKKEFEFISNDLSQKKIALDEVYSQTPYGEKEHQAVADYFRGVIKYSKRLEILIEKGKSSKKKKRKKGASSTSSSGSKTSKLAKEFPVLCEQIIVPLETWQIISDACEIGEYFVCNEEVRAYPGVVRKLLSKSSQLVTETSLGASCSSWNMDNKGDGQ